MEAVGLSTCALPPGDFTAQSFYKVTSAILDPSKHWYLLLKEVCGVPLRNFSYAMYLRYFPTKSKVSPRGNFSPSNHRLEFWRWTGFPTSFTLSPRSV